MIKTRYLEQDISEICFPAHKMAFISGPRQSGKTTMAKHLLQSHESGAYYNWDEIKFRKKWAQDPAQIIKSNSNITPIIILDEIHKAKLWVC